MKDAAEVTRELRILGEMSMDMLVAWDAATGEFLVGDEVPQPILASLEPIMRESLGDATRREGVLKIPASGEAASKPYYYSMRRFEGICQVPLVLCFLRFSEPESLSVYQKLFRRAPVPMYIYDRETFRFLDVNEAMTFHYGYSRAELLSMTSLQIRPLEERERLRELHQDDHFLRATVMPAGIWTHVSKEGRAFDVEVITYDHPWAGHSARLVYAFNVSDRNSIHEELEEAKRKLEVLVSRSLMIIPIPGIE